MGKTGLNNNCHLWTKFFKQKFISWWQINEVHAQFVAAMEKLFDKYKGRVGYEDLPLRIL